MSAVARHLEAALAQLADLDAARGELVAAWIATPCERLSRLVELVDARRDAVLPYQLANLGSMASTKAPAVLSAIAHDPRVAPELLDLLAKPPWRANPSLPFWRLCCARIVMTRDPRVLARLEEVALGYPQTIPTTVGHKVAGYLGKAARELRAAIAALPPFDERTEDALDALEARLDVRPAPKRTQGAEIASELLAAVYDAPHDDAPRLVLADHLQQRGDPRGEFMALQLARAAGRADDVTRARELELLAQSGGQWPGRIGMAIESERLAFHRGFVAYARMPRTKQTLASYAAERAWNTVEILDLAWTSVVGDADRAALAQILATSRGVRAVRGATTKFLAALPPSTLAKLEHVEVELGTEADRRLVLDWLASANRPHTLALRPRPARTSQIAAPPLGRAVTTNELARGDIEAILDCRAFSRLERLVLHSHQPQTWLPLVERTAVPVLVLAMSVMRVEIVRDGPRFVRGLAHHVVARYWSNAEAITRHLATVLGARPLVIDARTPFYPGMTSHPTTMRGWPTLEGTVDDLARMLV